MQQFIEKYREQINGALSGFDRLVFRGSLRRLNYGYYEPGLKAMVAKGMEECRCQNKILFKDYQDHVKQVSERLKKASLEPLEKQKIPVVFLRDPSADKNQTAREIASEKWIASGPVCVLSRSFAVRAPAMCFINISIHPETGWMLTSSAEERRPGLVCDKFLGSGIFTV